MSTENEVEAARKIAWIAERDKCDMEPLVHDFCDLVQENVRRMNAVCQQKERPPFHYTPQQGYYPAFEIVQHTAGQSRYCRAAYSEKRHPITVTMEHPDRNYTITTRWGPEKLKCRLIVAPDNGKKEDEAVFPHKHLWKVVQYILEPFFFKDAAEH